MSWQGYHWFHWVSLQGGRVVVVVVVVLTVVVVVAGMVDVDVPSEVSAGRVD
jgi:hypothetical protein